MKNDELIALIKTWLPRHQGAWDYNIKEVVNAIPINITDHARDNIIPIINLTQQDHSWGDDPYFPQDVLEKAQALGVPPCFDDVHCSCCSEFPCPEISHTEEALLWS